MSAENATSAMEARDLRFRYDPAEPWVLEGVNLTVPAGARMLLSGANGAGKTTLLRVLAGKHLITPENGSAQVANQPASAVPALIDAYSAREEHGVRYLGSAIYQSATGTARGDVSVLRLLAAELGDALADAAILSCRLRTRLAAAGALQTGTAAEAAAAAEDDDAAAAATEARLLAEADDALPCQAGAEAALATRVGSLLFTLDIDPRWRLHRVSDGQRRRVQILLSLIRPFRLLLLDEVTVDLDVLVRRDLLAWLRRETEATGASIIYATHIFDGLGSWVTHVAHVFDGHVSRSGPLSSFEEELAAVAARQARAAEDAAAAAAAAAGGTSSGGKTGSSALGRNSALLTLVETWLRDDQRVLAKRDAMADGDDASAAASAAAAGGAAAADSAAIAANTAGRARDGQAAKPDHIVSLPTKYGGSRFYDYTGGAW